MSRVLVIPDLHCPFEHRDALDFVGAVRDMYCTDMVVILGDELDFHAVSNYVADADGFSAGDELERGIGRISEWIAAFPKAKICTSNHTMRPWRKMEAAGIPRKLRPDLRGILGAPDTWKWSDYFEIDDVVYEHGDAIMGGKYPYAIVADRNMKSTVIGHHHGALGLYWHKTAHTTVFGMGVGCLVDDAAYAMAYGSQNKRKPILGAAVVIDGLPLLCKMRLNSRKRWNGRVGFEME